MRKLFGFLKGSIPAVILVLILLVFQALGDLSLPSYTSDIVNVGIQQSGIENPVPKVIRSSTLEKLKLFMSEENYNIVLENYDLKERDALSKEEYSSLLSDYPVIADEPIYISKDKVDTKQLSPIFARPIAIVNMLSGDSKDLGAMKEQMMAGMKAPDGVDPSSVDMITLIASMPQAQRDAIINEINSKFNQMEPSMVKQTAILGVREEYEAIGVNIGLLQRDYLLLTGGKMLLIALLVMVASVLVTLIAARVAAKIGRDLRSKVFKKVVSFSSAELDHFSTASLITRSTNDVQQVQMLIVMLLRMVLYAPILGIGGIIKVLDTNTSMAWIIALAVLTILLLVIVLLVVAMPKFNRMQKLVDRVNLVSREILTGLSVIRAFSASEHEEKRFDEANTNLTRNMLFTSRVMTFMMPTMMFIMNGISVLIIWVGAQKIDLGTMQVGDMMAFMQYTMQIVMSFLMLTMISIMFPRAAVAAKRIDEVLSTKNTILDPEKEETPKESQMGVVEFDHVSFRYPSAEEDVLSDITFKAVPGKTTAFIGSTGSGKSTLINLIPRFYDATKGCVRVNGVDVRKMSQTELRDQLGFVPQKGVLFSGTIESNLSYGVPDASKKQLEKAARIAQAKDFIEAKEDGYESIIAQGGSNVSGGQKQRLSIARAIAKDPKIYIFDDSFSALDYKTDLILRKALQAETGNSTVLIVAQRISTILHADQIIVLDEGRIAGIGTHEQLMKGNEIYRQIAMSQLSKEELEKDYSGKEVESHE